MCFNTCMSRYYSFLEVLSPGDQLLASDQLTGVSLLVLRCHGDVTGGDVV